MDHKTQKFTFHDKEGKPVNLFTVPFTFKIEQVLIDRFGKEALDEFAKTRVLNKNLNADEVVEDFIKFFDLKNLPVNDIDWTDQDFDTIIGVYHFLLTYKENALLRRLQFEKETLSSKLETMRNLMRQMPDDILKILNSQNLENKKS